MAARSYPADALFADRTAEPVGAPSLTDNEIAQLYVWWIGRPPEGNELPSERQNALKYSAAGIERQIANRAGNVGGSGVRGDEGSAALTVPAPPRAIPADVAGSLITMGPSALYQPTNGPTGLAGPYAGAYYSAAPSVGGFSLTTLAILAAVVGAAIYFMRK